MAAKVSKSAAAQLLSTGMITQEQYDRMVSEGVVSASSRSNRPEINIPKENKAEYTDKAYELLQNLADEMGIDHSTQTEDSGVVTLYLKGSGKPRNAKNEGEDVEEADPDNL